MHKLGQYVPGNSLIHKLDPRVKILFLLVLSILVLRADIFICFFITAFWAVIILISRLGVVRVVKSLKPVTVFFVLLFLIHLFFTAGTPVPPFPLWKISITYEGLQQGILLTWRFVLLVLGASVLTMSTLPTELVSAIERLLRPVKFLGISSHDVAMMLSLALRFVPTLLEETKKIREAQMARGMDVISGNLFQKIRGISSLAIPLLLNSCRRVEELASAMEARGYRRGPRTYMRELKITRLDYTAALVMTVFIAGVWFCR